MTLDRIINSNLTLVRSCSSHDFPVSLDGKRMLLTSLFLQYTHPLSASAQTATGHDVLVSESQEFAEKLTPPFVGSAIARWYKATSPLEKECPTFLPSAPTLPTIRPASFA